VDDKFEFLNEPLWKWFLMVIVLVIFLAIWRTIIHMIVGVI